MSARTNPQRRAVLYTVILVGLGGMISTGGCAPRMSPPGLDLKTETKPVLLDFHAAKCPTCRELDPTIAQLAEEYRGKAIVRKVEVWENQGVAEWHNIRKVPTVVLFWQGEEQGRWVGPRDIDVYRQALDGVLLKAFAPKQYPIGQVWQEELLSREYCSEPPAWLKADRSDASAETQIARP